MTRDAGTVALADVQGITPHIVVRGADRAAAWYAEAFGAVERRRVPVPDGRLMSVELRFGESAVMIADEFPEFGVLSPASIGGTAVVLNLVTGDAEGLWKRALDAGAEVVQPLHDAFWGERHGRLADPFGHHWSVAQQIRDVPHDEIVHAAAKMFGG